ncbi:MAG: hypothetical protein WB383_00720 [Acidimicrobiales bacterium]
MNAKLCPRPGGRRLTCSVLGVSAAVILTSVLAACGGGGSSASGVAHLGTTPTTLASTVVASDLAYSKCMRRNGVPNFPVPNAQGQFEALGGSGTGVDPGSPMVQHASKVCLKYLPQGAPFSSAYQSKLVVQALKFAKCMRAHGLPNFPDPDVGPSPSGIGIAIRLGGPGSGVNPQSPTFLAAQNACQKLLLGKPTPVKPTFRSG